MAQCKRCARKGSLFHPIKLNMEGYCDQCAQEMAIKAREETERRKAELEKRRAEEQRLAARRLEEAEKERQARQAAADQKAAELERARLAELQKPFDAPVASGGCRLLYSYTDVAIDCPDDQRAASQAVPPRKQLTFRGDIAARDVSVYHGDVFVGKLRDNKLMDMLQDFSDDSGTNVVPVSRYWTDQPAVDLFYYLDAASWAERLKRNPDFKRYTLTGNSKADVQDTLLFCHPCEDVTIEFDDEADKYAAYSSGDFIGHFPASATDYISEHEPLSAYIQSIDLKDSGKYAVSVMMIPAES